MTRIIDVCCGSRMFWFNRTNPDVIFMDNRELETNLCDGRKLIVKPDVIGDFRNIQYPDNTFNLVVFDPPHLKQAGDKSWLAQKYGKLNKESWPEDLIKGFSECLRILRPNGILVFKWNEQQIKINDVVKLCPIAPLFGNRHGKTHWLVFIK